MLLVSHGGVMNIILCLENGIPYTNKETRFRIEDAEIVMMQTEETFPRQNLDILYAIVLK